MHVKTSKYRPAQHKGKQSDRDYAVRPEVRRTGYFKPRNVIFVVFNLAALLVIYRGLLNLFAEALHNEVYSHIILIPLVTIYILYEKGKKHESSRSYSFLPGIAVIAVALGIFALTLTGKRHANLSENDYLAVTAFSFVVFFSGSYVLFYGYSAFRASLFAFLFLLFMVPIPTVVLERILVFLQVGSAEFAYKLLATSGAPVYREGMVFQLPTLSVEVAKQCSGIRSSLAIFITSILAGHFFLTGWWRRVVLTLVIIPVVMFTNGLRITILTLLGAYVDKAFLTNSFLHSNGGVLFFLLALSILGAVLWVLRKTE